MSRRIVFSVGVAASFAAASAFAQPTGGNIKPKTPLSRAEASPRDFSTKDTRALVHGYAQCVVGKRQAKASEALLRNIDNATFMRDYPSLIIGDCLVVQKGIRSDVRIGNVKMSFEGDLYRYALADALVRKELAAVPAPDFSTVAKLDHRLPGPAPQRVSAKGKPLSQSKYDALVKDYEENYAFSYLSVYGECVVRNAPAEARALLLTVPDSPEEKPSFDALQPALAECLPAGSTLRFGRTSLRGTIAINYYRLARAALGAPAGRTAG